MLRATALVLIRALLINSLLLSCVYLPSRLSGVLAHGQTQKPKATRIRRYEPNVYAPQLYADSLSMKFTLVDLPGAKQAGSYWEVSYRLYFITEAEYWNVIKEAGRSGQAGLDPSQFPEKIPLADGNFKGKQLATLKDRTYFRAGITFKAKIPDHARTKFAALITSYAVKIYDARLKQTLYRSSMWTTRPFDDDPVQPEPAIPRQVLYTNFFVAPQGELFESQWPRDNNNTDWP